MQIFETSQLIVLLFYYFKFIVETRPAAQKRLAYDKFKREELDALTA